MVNAIESRPCVVVRNVVPWAGYLEDMLGWVVFPREWSEATLEGMDAGQIYRWRGLAWTLQGHSEVVMVPDENLQPLVARSEVVRHDGQSLRAALLRRRASDGQDSPRRLDWDRP